MSEVGGQSEQWTASEPDSLKRLLPYYRLLLPYRTAFVGALFCALIYGAASGFGFPIVVKQNFPIIFGGGPASDRVLLITVIMLPLALLVRAVSGFYNSYLTAYCGVKVLEDLRIMVFEKLQRLHLGYFQSHNRGDLISRLVADCQLLRVTIVEVSNSLVKEPFTFIGAVVYLIYESVQNRQNALLIFFFLSVPLIAFPIRSLGKKIKRRARSLQRQAGDVTEVMAENLSAVREVRAFGLEDQQSSKLRRSLSKFLRYQLKVVKYEKLVAPTVEVVTGLVLAGAIYYVATSNVDLEADDVVGLFVALNMAYTPLKNLGTVHNKIRKGLAALERVEEILDEPVRVTEPEQPVPLKLPLRGEIVFDRVDFDYGDAPVLHEVSCVLEPARAYALVGRTGAGKSTFISLVPRFYDPVAGRITLDGVELRNCSLRDLRRQISIVPQDPILFNDTILSNIRMSRPDAEPEEIEEAARMAFAHDFIVKELSDGYETVVGDRGTRLSGGQRQRVAVARAFLKNSPILILDEATSSLDSESEAQIQAALERLVQGKTVIMIAHRFSTLKMADAIMVFDEGRLTGMGRHEELFAGNAIYRNLYERQELK